MFMYCQIIPAVRLPRNVDFCYSYTTPTKITANISTGQIVKISFRNRKTLGLVAEIDNLKRKKLPLTKTELKTIQGLEADGAALFPLNLIRLIILTADYFCFHPGILVKSIISKLSLSAFSLSEVNQSRLSLKINSSLSKNYFWSSNYQDYPRFYQQLLKETALKNQQTLLLAPEINIARKIAETLKAYEPRLVTGQTAKTEFTATWQQLLQGKINLVIGTRTALFLPFSRLGQLIFHQEHKPEYKSQATPRYHPKKIADFLSQIWRLNYWESDSSPSLESFYQIKKNKFTLKIFNNGSLINAQQAPSLTKMKSRQKKFKPFWQETKQTRQLPQSPKIIDMKETPQDKELGVISFPLSQAIEQTLKKGLSVFLFLNRKGYSTSVVCRDCGYIFLCSHCHLPLIYHKKAAGDNLKCHHCRKQEIMPPFCPQCEGSEFIFLGKGTQKVSAVLQRLFPAVKIIRIDKDTLLEEREKTSIRQLPYLIIGTEFAWPKIDWSKIGLVGVINADTALYRPDFRAQERTYQLLRQLQVDFPTNKKRLMIIQTYNPTNPAIQSLAQDNPLLFYEEELNLRKALDYPPFSEIIKLSIGRKNEKKAVGEAMHIYYRLRKHLSPSMKIEIYKPKPAFIRRQGNKYFFNLLIKNKGVPSLAEKLRQLIPNDWLLDRWPETLL